MSKIIKGSCRQLNLKKLVEMVSNSLNSTPERRNGCGKDIVTGASLNLRKER